MQNWVHDNAAVGGHTGFWVFTHTGDEFASPWLFARTAPLPDPVTGLNEWRNNKASAAKYGLQLDDSIQDEKTGKKFPNPQYSRSTRQNTNWMKSMSKEGWWSNNGQGKTTVYLTGWKMHHIYHQGAWIRNADVRVSNAQFSDIAQSLIFPSVDNSWGAQKVIKDSLFVGLSRNTGPWSCQTANGQAWQSFTELSDCPHNVGKITLFQDAPVPVPSPVEIRWWKPDGDVYRQVPFDKRYPQQGVSIYDTWMPTEYHNLQYVQPTQF